MFSDDSSMVRPEYRRRWYPLNMWGGVVLGSHMLAVATIVYADFLGVYPDESGFVLPAMLPTVLLAVVLVAMIVARYTGARPFIRKGVRSEGSGGFSLIELLIIISIIGILASYIAPKAFLVKDRAYLVRAQKEFLTMRESLELYLTDFGTFPPDANRDIPPGLEPYLAPGRWPDAPWPGSVYDWENWSDPISGEPIYQISIRFCPLGGSINTCRFPAATWADDFDTQSSVYYCIEGACRAHINQPITHPGYCVNCNE